MSRWEQVLAAIETDPMVADRQLDWVAKLRLIDAYRDRRGLDWDDPKLARLSAEWDDVNAKLNDLASKLEMRRSQAA